ncbi:UDP-forming cellulose synthase catalytic subunit [Halothiobacillus diazotrophicus]|nr:UDP-forming cellulose synthase catalytic subunit [Halothiobacillus diazotrophicus]
MKRNTRFMGLDDLVLVVIFVFGAIMLLPMIVVPFDWQDQAWLGFGFVLLAVLVNRLFKPHWITYFLMALSLFATARYAWWRTTETLGFNSPDYHWYDLTISLILYAAEVYAWIVLVLGFLQTAAPLKRKPLSLPPKIDQWPSVDVYIPTYNEPIEVVRPTVLAAMQMDWPHDKLNVCLLDDGGREEFRQFAEEVGVTYIIRDEHKHAKAGNLNHAMTKTHGEYIAIFDCDHVPTRSFLQMSMGWFLKDEHLALVQTPHHFYSPDPFERNLKVFKEVPNEGELFYGIVQDGNDLWDATFFCGSCAVIRREALDQIGGIAIETVTEDAHTSLKLQRLGWRSAYINLPQAAGLATESFSGHVGQRVRWARGMAQIMRVDNPLLGRGLQFMQRLCYLNAMLHFFFALPRLIFLTAPLLFLYFGIYVINAYALTIAAYALPHLALAMIANSRVQGKHRNSFWNEVYETALAPYILLPTLLAVINPKLGKFNVTAKGGLVQKDYFDRKIARPFVILFLLNVGGLIAAAIRWWGHPNVDIPTLVMTTAWTVYNLAMILVVLGVNWETKQVRKNVRIPISLPARVIREDQSIVMAKTVDISEGGGRVITAEPIPEGENLILAFLYDGEEYALPIRKLPSQGDVMRFQFREMNHLQFGYLVRVIYGRADAWLGWGEGRRVDRPWRSLVQISFLALVGLTRLVRGAFGKEGGHGEAAETTPVPKNPAPEPKLEDTTDTATVLPPMAGRVTSVILAGICALTLWAQMPQPALAANEVPDQPTTTSTKGQFNEHWAVGTSGAVSGLKLHGVDEIQSLDLSIPPDRVVSAAQMTLTYTISPGLLPRISQINVLFNDHVVRSFPIEAGDDKGLPHQVSFPIDANLFTEYNHVGFQLIGHYTDQCEDPMNSTLWATISPKTEIAISGLRLPIQKDLRFLPAPFFYKSAEHRLNLPFVFASDTDTSSAQAAGIVASWFGTLASYRGSNFPVNIRRIPEQGNAVVFALKGQPLLPNEPKIEGATVAVTANPNDPYGTVLWVLGSSDEELIQAAQNLVLGANLLNGEIAHVGHVNLPPIPAPDSAPRWVPSTGPVRLDALSDWTPMSVKGTGTLPFTFYLPPSLFYWNRDGVPLNLHYGYNSIPLAQNSSLNLEVNGQFIRSYPLKEGDKAKQEQHVSLTFPQTTLSPYANLMKGTFYFVPIKGKCTETNVKNAAGSIYPDSTIDISDIPHYARLPELSIWINGGYPFTRFGDLSRTAVVLPQKPDIDLLQTYLNVMGLFGQFTGMPGFRVKVVNFGDESSVADRDLLTMSTPAELSAQSWQTQLPVSFENQHLTINDALGWFSDVRWHLPWWHVEDARFGKAALGKIVNNGVVPRALIQETISPFHPERILLSLSAGTDSGWQGLQETLDTPALRTNVFGGLSIVHGDKVSSFVLDRPHYYAGTLSWWDWMRFHLSQHPWMIWLGVVVLALILSGLVGVLLQHRARKRLATS